MLREKPTPVDPAMLLLSALAWICTDDDQALRLLDLTGMDAEQLRRRAGEPATLMAVGEFLANHEPSLLACAQAIGCTPHDLANAAARLEHG